MRISRDKLNKLAHTVADTTILTSGAATNYRDRENRCSVGLEWFAEHAARCYRILGALQYLLRIHKSSVRWPHVQ